MKSLRSIDELLADVEPIGKDRLLARDRSADTVSIDITLPAHRFPVPAIVRFIMISHGGVDLGPAEKVAWQYPIQVT